MSERITAAMACLAAAWLAFGVAITSANAADVTLRMKDGSFEINGQLKSFDGSSYIIKSDVLGLLELRADRYECDGSGCPGSEPPAAAGTAALSPPAGTGETRPAELALGNANFIGGSAIGTRFMPELISSYAASRGLLVRKSIDKDDRDLLFTLTEPGGREAGRVAVRRRGVPAGMAALLGGEADLVWTSRPVTEDENRRFLRQGIDLTKADNEHVFALDALVVLVNKKNPLLSLSTDQIADIFAGRITDWSELGGEQAPINVYAPIDGMGTWAAFKSLVLDARGLDLTSNAKRLATAVEWSDAVAADPNGIGINMIAYIRETQPLNIRQSCGLISRPTVFSAKTEEFPFARRLYFYTRGQPESTIARELLAFALSSRAQEALKNAEFVDQEIELLPFREQGGRIAFALNAQDDDFRIDAMREFVSDVAKASRMSTTFRFALGSAFLDNKAEEDIARLATELKKPEYEGRKVVLIGFTDSLGNFEVNREVALARAQTVANALGRAGFKGAEVRAYGELAPVTCNNTPENRFLNRRVEVWVE